ncbi:MAG: oligosaccharide flippase family protein [Endomicrobiales bacterium]|nr:oligosaccharide flippase family protein [Endomicrobiales bacterium]
MSEHVKNSLFFASSSYLARFVGVIAGIFMKNILGPTVIGSAAFITVVDSYVNYTYGVVRGAVAREIPVLRGAGDAGGVKDLYNTSYGWIVINTIIGSVVFLVFGLLGNYNPVIKFGFFVYAAINVFQSFSNYYSICLSVEKKFKQISIIYFASSVFQHMAMLSLSYYFNYRGYFVGFLLGVAVQGAWYRLVLKVGFKFEIKWEEIKRIVVLGAPLLVYGFIQVSFQNIDKIFIQANYPIEYLGYYNTGVGICILSVLLPESIYSVYTPKYLEYLGAKQIEIAKQKAVELFDIIRTIMPFALGVVWVSLTPLIQYLLPKFVPGIMPAKILILGIYFNSLFMMYYYYLVGTHQFRYVLYISAVALAATIMLNYTAVKLPYGINGVAAAVATAYFLYSLMFVFVGNWRMGNRILVSVKALSRNIFYAIPLIMLFPVSKYVRIENTLMKATAELLIFLGMNALFMYRINRKSQAVQKVYAIISKRSVK